VYRLFSYRQTIEAYPTGGGSYTVSSENLGSHAGLLAGAALMVDYILTAAVGISAGIGALVSAVPSLQPHTLGLCLATLLVLTIVNLRGVREVGAAFMLPSYLFVATLLGTIVIGVIKTLVSGGHPTPMVHPPPLHAATTALTPWLLLQSFSSGCTAMTGVEAVSNGVRVFCQPVVKSAQRTLTAIIAILVVMLAGISLSGAGVSDRRHTPGPGPGTKACFRCWSPQWRARTLFITSPWARFSWC